MRDTRRSTIAAGATPPDRQIHLTSAVIALVDNRATHTDGSVATHRAPRPQAISRDIAKD
jgi:hypothetical protein